MAPLVGASIVNVTGVEGNWVENIADTQLPDRSARRALLAEATSDLAISLSVTDSLQRLARLAIPELANWVIIDLGDENAQAHQVAMLHRDGHQEAIERFSALQLTGLTEQAPIMRVLATGLPILHAETSIDVAAPFVTRPELIEICDRLGVCSVMYVPMVARGRTLGCLTLVTGLSARHYDQQDLEFAMGLAQRAALVVDNSSLYEREHEIANPLQESLLPVVPRIPGLDIAVRYRPSDTHAQVGGEWSATSWGTTWSLRPLMGQLRSHLRACAWEAAVNGASDPGAILDHTDRLVHGLTLAGLATAFYAKIERELIPDPTRTLTYATAGHPMPLIRWPSGRATELEVKVMAMGVSTTARRSSRRTAVPEGSILVAFTDGLVERRNRDWSEGVESVRRALEITPTGN